METCLCFVTDGYVFWRFLSIIHCKGKGDKSLIGGNWEGIDCIYIHLDFKIFSCIYCTDFII